MQNFKNDKLVVGLDIGTTKICAIVGRMNEHGKLEILGLGKSVSEGVIRGMVMNINSTVDAITKAMREAELQAGVDIKVVNVGIAGQHIKSSMHRGSIMRVTTDDEITPADVDRLTNDMYKTVMPYGSEIIHVMPQLYTVDYQEGIKDAVGMSGVRLEADFHVITAQTNAINNINKCIIKSGLEIDKLILEPIASSLSVLSDEEKEAGVVLVDIGGGTTDVAIFHDNIIRHTAVIPFGGNVITNDIQQGCAVMLKQAELLKTKFGRALANEANPNEIVSIPGLRNRAPKEISVKNLAHIIQARMEEIIEMVFAEIVSSGYEGKLAGGIVVTGGGAQLQYIKQLFELVTGMDARIGYPNEHLGKSKVEVVKSPMYATGVGLVLSGFTSIDDRDNKYSELIKRESKNDKDKKEETSKKSSRTFDLNLNKFQDKLKGFLAGDIDDSLEY
ncbi:MAG TPA: cell division protein FtsA [Cytophagaceae bacterium]|nr:cell division protein FtsA [Cytophagaceae bacterium]